MIFYIGSKEKEILDWIIVVKQCHTMQSCGTGGYASGIFFTRKLTIPYATSVFTSATTKINVPVEIIPGINIKLNDHIHLELNIPIIVHDFVFEIRRIDNYAVSEKLRKTKVLYGHLLPAEPQMKFGVSYTIK